MDLEPGDIRIRLRRALAGALKARGLLAAVDGPDGVSGAPPGNSIDGTSIPPEQQQCPIDVVRPAGTARPAEAGSAAQLVEYLADQREARMRRRPTVSQ